MYMNTNIERGTYKMAKKVLTPEEVQAKMEKKAAKRKLFFGTFTKALAFFLAIAIAWSLAAIAFTPEVSGTASSGTTSSGTTSSGTTSAGTTTDTPVAADPSIDTAAIATAMNDASAKAAKGNYKIVRTAKYQEGKGISVVMMGSDATSTLNSLISGIDEGSTVDSVVGGFLGIGTKEITVKGGKGTVGDREVNSDEQYYLIKAMSLQAGDIMNASQNGDTYTFSIANAQNPERDNASPMSRATNDFITFDQVKNGVEGATSGALKVEGADVTYYNITVEATIKDGAFTSLKLKYSFDAALNLKLALAIDGSGSADVEAVYTF